MDPQTAPRCLVATGDLMGWSRLSGVVRAAGLEPRQVRGPAGVTDDPEPVRAVVVELADPHGGIPAVQAAHGRDPRPLVIAIGPHVDGALLAAARAAGADAVLPHSAVGEPLAARLRAATGRPESGTSG